MSPSAAQTSPGDGDALALPDRIDVVFCDVGGPIYSDDNFTSAVVTGLNDIRAERGLEPVDRAAFDRLYDDIRANQSGGLRRTLARELLGDESLRHELHHRTERHWVHPAGSAYPDALELFKALHGHVLLGVVANQEAATVEALRRDGFGEHIDIWGISAVVGHEKPSREFFEWALAEAEADAVHAVHIGNRLDTDVRPARALGMGTIWVTRGEAPPDPTPEQLAEADLSVPDLTTVAAAILPRARSRD
jgi:FMN phosphatase YigB (HAD superfamily)